MGGCYSELLDFDQRTQYKSKINYHFSRAPHTEHLINSGARILVKDPPQLQKSIVNPEIHRASPEKVLVPTPSVAKDLMPRDIMSSEPRHWMVFGQLVMPVQCCAEAPAEGHGRTKNPKRIQNGPTDKGCPTIIKSSGVPLIYILTKVMCNFFHGPNFAYFPWWDTTDG